MATTVTKSIGTSSRDYSTPQAWEDASPANLVTADQIWRGECYNDGEFLEPPAQPVINISGSTTDATRYKELTAATGQSFQDHANVRTNPLRYDVTKGVGFRSRDNYNPVVFVQEQHLRCSRLQIRSKDLGTSGGLRTGNAGGNAVLKDLLIVSFGAGAPYPSLGTWANETIINVTVVVTSATGRCVGGENLGIVTFIGCTFVRATDNAPNGEAIHMNYNALNLISCAICGFTSITNKPDAGSSRNNATDLASGLLGSNNQYNVPFSSTTPFTSASLATLDMRAITGTALSAHGYRDATNAPNDISKFARTATPTIGAWELFTGTAYTATLTATLTSSGAAARAVTKTAVGTMASTGALAFLIRHAAILTGVLATSGTLKRDVGKGLDGTVTPTGTGLKAATTTVSGTLAMAGTLTSRATLGLTGVIGAVGTIVTTFIHNRVKTPIHILNFGRKAPGIKNLRRK